MPRRRTKQQIDPKKVIVESIQQYCQENRIDKRDVAVVLEEVLRKMVERRYGTSEHFRFIVNLDVGDIQAFRKRKVVPDHAVQDETKEIALSEAKLIDPYAEVGETVDEEVNLRNFDRRQISYFRQVLKQALTEIENVMTYEKYKKLEGEVIIGTVVRIQPLAARDKEEVKPSYILVKHEDTELILPRSEMIPKEVESMRYRYRQGAPIRALIKKVEKKRGRPEITLSRTDPKFLERLLEREVPEIYDGLIVIKKVVRAPGERAKVAVESFDDRIDPVGACVGVGGNRIYNIVKELRGENIDVIAYSNNPALFIRRALSPAKVTRVEVDLENKTAKAYLPPDQISIAIGKGGVNIRLAAQLTGFQIEAEREEITESEIPLETIKDQIDEKLYKVLKEAGFQTVKSILEKEVDALQKLTGLDLDTVNQLLSQLQRIYAQENPS